ncbi:MAG: ABC-F family ATP-binding cassette domain-containing protein [Alphaproteobacteria bacterium]|nr:ABC-F family ATP-binding cassette domain-containing protein [Alphaproteobacteria bacterium]
MLTLHDIVYRIGGRVLLDDVRLQLADGQRAGLVGRNGCGKSTLFKIILDEVHADGGKSEVSKGQKIITVKQEVPGGDQTPLEFLLASDQERSDLFHAIETCQDPNKLGDYYERLIQIDAYSAEARASIVLKGLGFSEEEQNRALSSFSGGYRMRVALAAALFQQPDVLLLDEPTNHLDLEATIWLKEFLKSYPNSLLIISHDRELMNDCVDIIFHLQQGKITRYGGNYDTYIRTYTEQQMFAAAFNAKVDAQRKHLRAFVDRFSAGTRSKQAQSRVKALEKLSSISIVSDDPTVQLNFPASEELSPPIIHFEKVSLGYGDNIVLNHLSGNIAPNDRIGLLGANGNGKSTFAKFLAGRLQPLTGVCTMHPKLRVGYFHQHQLEDLDRSASALQQTSRLMATANETQVRSHLGRFGFSRDKAEVRIESLSGGEKARLVFALITLSKPHLLILDEPTNHLDIEMRESLMMSINDFSGAVILIAHDWHLLNLTVDRLWVVKDHSVTPYTKSLEDYRQELLGKKSESKEKGQGSKKKGK